MQLQYAGEIPPADREVTVLRGISEAMLRLRSDDHSIGNTMRLWLVMILGFVLEEPHLTTIDDLLNKMT